MKTRVVIVDDSMICRAALREILERDNDIEVIAEGRDGAEALRLVKRLKPDLTTIDIMMPHVGGLEAIENIMSDCPVPILVVTGQPTGEEAELVFQAVKRGALDLAEKPEVWGDNAAGEALRKQVRMLAKVPVIRHLMRRRKTVGAALAKPARRIKSFASPASAQLLRMKPRPKVIGIGASAGGPGAVAALLGALQPDCGCVIAVVQHVPIGFAEAFARFLRSSCSLPVRLVDGRIRAQPGEVLVAIDDRHLVARRPGVFVASDAAAIDSYRPSVDALMHSLADVYGRDAIGVILSGIGSDGAEGLLAMRQGGAMTLAQDEETSAVYGMPRAAAKAGACEYVFGLPDLAVALAQLTGGR